MLPAAIGDAAYQAANQAIKGLEWLINKAVDGLNKLSAMANTILPQSMQLGQIGQVSLGRVDNPYAGANASQSGIARNEIGAAQNVDYVGKIQGAVVAGANYLVDKVRGLASGLGAEKDKKDKKSGADKAAKGGKTEAEKQAEAFDKLRMSTEAYVRSKAAETAAIGLGAREAAMLKHTPLGRLGEADDIANAALFLCAPASAWVSGQVLTVSGGGVQELD